MTRSFQKVVVINNSDARSSIKVFTDESRTSTDQ